MLGYCGSTTMQSTGVLGRSPLMSLQFTPPLTVRNTWPRLSPKPVKPEKVTYAVVDTVGSTATCVMTLGGRPVLTLVQVAAEPAPAFLVTCTWLSPVPAYTVFEFVGATAM